MSVIEHATHVSPSLGQNEIARYDSCQPAIFFSKVCPFLMDDNSDFQQAKRAALLANIAKLTGRLKVSNK